MFARYLALFSIPTLIGASWLLGGTLVRTIDPLTLSFLRNLLSATALIPFVLTSTKKEDMRLMSLSWFAGQIFLTITGRVLYYYFATRSLLSIRPVESILIATSLPLYLMLFAFFIRRTIIPLRTTLAGILAVGCTVLAILRTNTMAGFAWQPGHSDMIIAMLFFAIHLFYYPRLTRSASASSTLFLQFGAGAIIMATIINRATLQSIHWTSESIIQLLIFAIGCNLVPFILVHRCLRFFPPLVVGNVSLLSPVLAYSIQCIMGKRNPDAIFLVLAFATAIFVFLSNYYWELDRPDGAI